MTSSNAASNFGRALAIALLAPLSFCVALPMGLNEIRAMDWGRLYGQMLHPPGTQRIAMRQGIEKLSNGDNCDFLILEARSFSAGEEASILAFYALRENPIDPNANSLHPTFIVNHAPAEAIEPYRAFYSAVAQLYGGPYYVLEAWQVVESAPPLVDWRCP